MALAGAAGAQPAPWDAVPASKQLFVLITGANSGVGLGTGQHLIDDFLATQPLDAHLILIPTTRSATKSLDAIRALRSHAVQTAKTSAALRSRVGEDTYRWEDTVRRIHILSVCIDLCDLRNVREVATRLCKGTISNPEGLEGEYLRNVRIPRLDSVICNAAYGGWSGVNYGLAIWHFLTHGLIQSVTWPEFKNSLPTCILNEQPRYNYPNKPLLGEVFCACVFGHYMLNHQLLPLLSRSSTDDVAPGRIIWTSSLEAVRRVFSAADLQCFIHAEAYESAKRLTDILALTSSLPSVKPISNAYFSLDNLVDSTDDPAKATREQPIPPRMYVTHPGIMVSTIIPLPWYLFWAYRLAVVLCRWLGSPWHTEDGYPGSKSTAWVVLESQPALDAVRAERIKWGSSLDRRLNSGVKVTEVEGWGWEGRVETAAELAAADPAEGLLRKSVGRKRGVVDATAEDIAEFEELGVEVWKQMEGLRVKWAEILDEDHEE